MSQLDALTMLQFIDMLLKQGNFTKAAKSLYISQPYLTQVIKRKEVELGVELIDRQSHPFQLTTAGQLYHRYLITQLANENQLKKQLETFVANEKTPIKLGVLASLGTYLLPLFLPNFQKNCPSIQVQLTEDVPSRNEKRLLNNEIDFLIGQNPETLPPNLKTYARGNHGYYAVIPESSQLYQPGIRTLPARSISVKSLLQEPLILTLHGSAIRQQIDYLIQKFQIQPTILLESNNIFTIAKLAQSDMGITFLPDSVPLVENGGNYNIYRLPTEDISLNYFIAHRDSKVLTEPERTFIQFFLDEIQRTIHATNENIEV